jgi:hypothetical protein
MSDVRLGKLREAVQDESHVRRSSAGHRDSFFRFGRGRWSSSSLVEKGVRSLLFPASPFPPLDSVSPCPIALLRSLLPLLINSWIV